MRIYLPTTSAQPARTVKRLQIQYTHVTAQADLALLVRQTFP